MNEYTFVRKELGKYGVIRFKRFNRQSLFIYEFMKDVYVFRIMKIKEIDYWLLEKVNKVTNEFFRCSFNNFNQLDKELGRNLKGDEYMDIRIIYNKNPLKFKEVAKDKTYDEFIKYLQSQNGFAVIDFMTEQEKKMLYHLSKEA